MISENGFDMVFDCQKVFKAFMNALARPGRIFSIGEQVEKLEGDNRVLTAAALSLLDNRCRYYVHQDEGLAEQLRELTMAVRSGPETADYIFVPDNGAVSPSGEMLLEKGKRGTLPEPHKSAVFLVMVESFAGGKKAALTGPGVDGKIEADLPAQAAAWLKERDNQGYEFPCGVEIIFCTGQGELTGIPRSVKAGGI